ncbi:hypothetical protein [Psychrobacillus sp. FSL H8-0510]|uniref:hypothetical protein n=1 Tax=Psychrobacillus sp. FSL H8-0510 TaxID=2921394 RepID=UPI0030FBD4E2
MHSALLTDGKVITAKAYEETLHGVRLSCIDKSCGVPIIFIPESKEKEIVAHFRTSGKGASIHKTGCGFAKKLSFSETVEKVTEYQASLREQGIREFIVRLNLDSIDPDFVPKEVNREPNDTEKEKSELDDKSLKESNPTPQSIGSLKAVKKLFTNVEPDLLASIIISVKGTKIPISELIRSNRDAHIALWQNKTMNLPYFIHGTVDKVIRREKVWYVNFEASDASFFSLVVFEKHFKHFTFKDAELVGKNILAYGYLKKNEFNKDRPATEMIIKSNRYLEFL